MHSPVYPHPRAAQTPEPHDASEAMVAMGFASLSVDAAMRPAAPLALAQAIMIRAHWLSSERDSSRVAIALADVKGARGQGFASPGALAQALGDRARDALLRAGAKAPPSALDDYPSAPAMVSDDVCSVSLAVSLPPGMGADALDAALGAALDAMFEPGAHFRRHIRASLSGSGGFERAANALLASLRRARASANAAGWRKP